MEMGIPGPGTRWISITDGLGVFQDHQQKYFPCPAGDESGIVPLPPTPPAPPPPPPAYEWFAFPTGLPEAPPVPPV